MHRHVIMGLCMLTALCTSGGANAQGPPTNSDVPLALTNANVVNVRTGRIIVNATIILRDGRIATIGTNAAPADTEVVDLKGK